MFFFQSFSGGGLTKIKRKKVVVLGGVERSCFRRVTKSERERKSE